MNLIIEKKRVRDGAGYWVRSPIGEAALEPGLSSTRLRLTWFEVDATQRGQGLGARFLAQIRKAFPDKAIHPVNRLLKPRLSGKKWPSAGCAPSADDESKKGRPDREALFRS